jgi:hypothetical protein
MVGWINDQNDQTSNSLSSVGLVLV